MANKKQLPGKAQVVIIGGGIIGCSTAYHLTKLGIEDVVLLERKQLTCGTTWHAAGLVGQLRATRNMTALAQYSARLFATLEEETGQATGYRQTGSLSLALNEARFTELKRGASMARSFGCEVNVLPPEEVAGYWPLINLGGVIGAVFLPGDGQTNPVDTTQALARGAKNRGARIFENTKVTSLITRNGKAIGVATEVGDILCDTVVLAAGMWSHKLAAEAGVDVPLHAAEHFYIVTEPMAGLVPGQPTLRIPDEQAYYKEDAGKLLLGCFEPSAKPWGMDGIPEDFSFDSLPEDFDHFEPILEKAVHRFPKLADAGIQLFFNGPESFTPDDRYLLGEAPEVEGLFIAAGFNSVGIQSSGGAGKVLAEWIRDRHPPIDLWDVDIRRMMPFQSSADYLHDRTVEGLGLLYAMHWPFKQYGTARGARQSPFHHQLLQAGAVMGETAGWERPNWFAKADGDQKYRYSFGRQNWWANCEDECLATRDAVALYDQSSYAKYLLQGQDACTVLGNICANDIDVAAGTIVYTQWLNGRGGIEADLTVTRIAEDEFLIVTACPAQTRDFAWLKRHIPEDAHAFATDITSGLPMLGLMGPNARALLSSISQTDFSNEAFPFGTSKEIEIGYAKLRASRITYVGELGWELYVPAEFAAHVYDRIVSAGEAFGLKHAGYHAMDACRLEKGYRHWGHDITDEDTPLEAGLGFAVALDKPGDFIGKTALFKARAIGKPKKRLVQVAMVDNQPETPTPFGDEPLYRDGELVGTTTSAMWGHRVGRALAMGYVTSDNPVTKSWLESAAWQIEIACERLDVRVQFGAFYDPKSLRVKS